MEVKEEIILVGLTSAYEIGLNEFKEVILAEALKKNLEKNNIKSRIIIFNDDIDPLKERHCRILKKQYPKFDYSDFVGKPIFLIASPVNGFSSLSEFFLYKFKEKIEYLNIEIDEYINSSQIRNQPQFLSFQKKILLKKEKICKFLLEEHNLDYKKKYFKILGENNKYLEKEFFENLELKGKFSWSIECFLRWQYTKANYEFFTKHYLTFPLGSYHIASSISKQIFLETAHVPQSKQYEPLFYSPYYSDYLKILGPEKFKEIIVKRKNKSDIIQSSTIANELKNLKTQNGHSYYNLLLILSHFSREILEFKEFKENFINFYLKNEEEKLLEDLLERLDCFKKIFCNDLNLNKKELNFVINQVFNNNPYLKFMNLDYDLFKKLLFFSLQKFGKGEILNLNELLFGKKQTISLSLFMFLLPKRYFFMKKLLEGSEENTIVNSVIGAS